MAELFPISELATVLLELGDEVKAQYIHNLEEHDRRASGDLLRSISTEVEVRGTRYIVWMNLADYWKYVEEGTRPHWPPKDAIDRWIFIKPVIPHPMANGKLPSPEQLSYMIRRKISLEGTTGSHDLRDAKREILPKFMERLSEALHHDALAYIEKILP
jgi:hypothetical protein